MKTTSNKPARETKPQAVRVSIPARIHITVRADREMSDEEILELARRSLRRAAGGKDAAPTNTAQIGPYALGAVYPDGGRRRGKVVRRFGDRAWRLALCGEGDMPV